jgi:hypothetical protein
MVLKWKSAKAIKTGGQMWLTEEGGRTCIELGKSFPSRRSEFFDSKMYVRVRISWARESLG